MSHFTVTVITKEEPTGALIESLMAPYKEFDGEDLRFVQDVDITDEVRQEYVDRQERRIRSPDGTLHAPWEDEFYRDPTPEEVAIGGPLMMGGTGSGDGLSWDTRKWKDGRYGTRIQFVPEGWSDERIPAPEIMSFPEFIKYWHEYEGIAEWAQPDYEDKHSRGYFVTNEAGEVTTVVRRTNPNGHYDWYEIGGRWSGELRVIDPELGVRAEDHWTGKAPADGFDISRRDNLDVEAMRAAVSGQRRSWLEQIAGRAEVNLTTLERILLLYKEAQQKWLALEPRPYGEKYRDWLIENFEEGKTIHKVAAASFHTPQLKEGQTIEAFIADVVPLATHAVIIDGKWMQRGKMGMFASVHGKKFSEEEWEAHVWKTIEETPSDHWITVIDCHV